ncbi:MAG: MBL fold metallo-hydrolase [Allobranchiibius sp.]
MFIPTAEIEDMPVADDWFMTTQVHDRLSVIVEPHVHPFLRANIWHLRGRDRDLIVDTGLGVGSLREHLPHLFDRDPVVVITHAHLDHAGGAHEFDLCHAHPTENITAPAGGNTLRGPELADQLGMHNAVTPGWLIDALPHAAYRPGEYRLHGAVRSAPLLDGVSIDLGDQQLTVLHLPGHSPGCIGLYAEAERVLFSGDVVYDLETDEQLLDGLHGSSIEDYIASMHRLRELDVAVVYPGHGPVLQAARCGTIIDAYLDRNETFPAPTGAGMSQFRVRKK